MVLVGTASVEAEAEVQEDRAEDRELDKSALWPGMARSYREWASSVQAKGDWLV